MASEMKKVKLIRGASYVIPGYRFVPGVAVDVPAKIVPVLKASQQFSIKDVDDDDEPETSADNGGEDTPTPKKKRKRR